MKRIVFSLLPLTILLAFQNCAKWQGDIAVSELSQDGMKLAGTAEEPIQDDQLDDLPVDMGSSTSGQVVETVPPVVTVPPVETLPPVVTLPVETPEIVFEDVDPDTVDQTTCDQLVAKARKLKNLTQSSIQNKFVFSRGRVYVLDHDLEEIENLFALTKFVVVGATEEGQRRVKINSIRNFLGRGVFCNLDVGSVTNLVGYLRLYTGNVDSVENCIGNIKVSNGHVLDTSRVHAGFLNTCHIKENN